LKSNPTDTDRVYPLHIDLGNQSIKLWLKKNRYIVHGELVRYCQILLEKELEFVQALMLSNFNDNVVFIIYKDTIHLTLQKAMDYFLDIEEYELCAKIRDLQILIEKSKTNDEKGDTGDNKQNKRESKIH
jgi:hypothetical protein